MFVATFKFDQAKFCVPTMTLRKRSRSNGWYVRKDLDRCFQNTLVSLTILNPFSLWKGQESVLHRITCENWTMTNKIHKVGRSDLVLGVQDWGPLRCLQTWYEPPSCSGVETCKGCLFPPSNLTKSNSFQLLWPWGKVQGQMGGTSAKILIDVSKMQVCLTISILLVFVKDNNVFSIG